ncbi:MAG: F0F1 ATP synthase subunit gamma [Betaproteobacteria bacterium]|jgi:F-type H+-transporting ATPase subunit gamma|nr:F0F1 ATP synthase subunit gamma [Betaproteobacteria bacterium]NBS93050.1 F0F1 ATP synthase subunit gamma [Betaproteobacteria bacterium]NBY52567.1 F0F1 ATP synthase subunit gamma [Betaproteobacteria bacterium]NCU94854.1 F0F1 ATP synthase subunit gamma [Betaproteobacteria bacterium]NDF70604.1 F0F1 ATP synthase subunit gamma [Betaproteobacteria bacterium]
MPSSKEIRTKIKSVENTRKITKAMEMVAASKMRKAQERMRAARPYGEKIRRVAANMSNAFTEYRHPYLVERETVKTVGLIIVTSDKGLCGALNSNVLRLGINKLREWDQAGIKVKLTAIGNKGFGLLQRAKGDIVSHVTGLGDTPVMDKLIGPVKVMLDAYTNGEIDRLYIVYTRFINTMKQEAQFEQLLPLSGEMSEARQVSWDYVYEPEPKAVIEALLTRYIEALIYGAVAENMASEQSARMVAMKAASDNAKNVIGELKLVYNKTRQAAITKELAEIVGGAAAV